jgi:hypothetical protein
MHLPFVVSRTTSTVALSLVAGIVSLLANACADNPASPTSVNGIGANLAVMLTDAPIDDVEQVNIHFTSVTAKPEGKPVQELTLALTQNPVNLLALTDRTISFATGLVEPGRYEFVHINIDARRSNLVEKGVQKSLQVPSEEVKILGGFAVDNDHKTTITLDFDARSSLVRLGNGEWLLRPIIVMTGNNSSSQQ